MQTAQAIAEFTSCNNLKISGYQLTTLLIRNGKKLGLKSSELLVFMALASYWNGKPVYPKINTLSDDTTLSEKAVRTALNGLLSKGFIIKSKRSKNANVYNLNVSMVISTIQTGKSNLSSAVEFTAPCNMKLNHEKLEQRHEVVVSFKESKGVEEETLREASSTAVSVSSETHQFNLDEIPEIISKNKNIRNIKRYWGSLRPAVKLEYWQEQEKKDRLKRECEELERLEAEQKAKEKAEQEAYDRLPLNEKWSYAQAVKHIWCLRWALCRRGYKGFGLTADLVELYDLNVEQICQMTQEEIEQMGG